MPRRWRWAKSRAPSRAPPRSVRSAITSQAPIPPITSRLTSPSTCCRRWTTAHDSAFATTKRRAMKKSAAVRWRRWKNFEVRMSDLAGHITAWLQELERTNASVHTTRAYASDLGQFLEYFTPPDGEPPAATEFD